MIIITTKLHSGLTRSLAGKEFHTEFNTGPLNLLKAVREYRAERAESIRSYGNIGCGHTWLEIDGVHVPNDFFPVDMDEARWLISAVRNGEFQRWIEDCKEAEDIRYRADVEREFRS